MSLLSCGPIWHFETLKESSRSSVESYISHSFKQGVGMEELSVDVRLDVWLFVELIAIEVLNSNSYIINIKIY